MEIYEIPSLILLECDDGMHKITDIQIALLEPIQTVMFLCGCGLEELKTKSDILIL